MRMSLLRPEFLDRDLPITAQERRSIFREAWKRWLRHPVNFALHAGWFLLFIIPTQIAWGDWLPMIARGGWADWLLRLTVPFVVGAPTLMLLQRLRMAPLVRQIARERGYDICTRCGYWLRGLPDETTTCPECGAQR
jgi:hypothetical protein